MWESLAVIVVVLLAAAFIALRIARALGRRAEGSAACVGCAEEGACAQEPAQGARLVQLQRGRPAEKIAHRTGVESVQLGSNGGRS